MELDAINDGCGRQLETSPLVEAFEGNRAETTTMLPTIRAFMAAHRLADVTIAQTPAWSPRPISGRSSAAGLSFILGARIPDIPYLVTEWRRQHPGDGRCADGLVLTQPRPSWPARPPPRRGRLLPVQARHVVLRARRRATESTSRVHQGTPAERRSHRAAHDGREGSGGDGAGQAQPVHRPGRWRRGGQPHPGGQGPCVGRVEGLHHKPRHLPRRRTRHRRVRDRRLPPALPD